MIVTSLNYLPSQQSSDLEWIEYHKQLKKELGRSNANSLWSKTWAKRKNEGVLGSKANTSVLREYINGEGIELSGDGAFKFAIDSWDSISDSFESAFGISKWLFIALALLVIIPAFVLMMNVAKNPQNIIGAIK